MRGAGRRALGAVYNWFSAVFLVKIHGYRVKNARKVSNLAALFALYPRIFSQKTASQTNCKQPLGWSIGVDSKTHELAPTQGWQPSWVIFARLVDDSVLFADTAQPECPVFWLPIGYGTVENRTSVAPSLAAFMDTLAALRELETAYEGSEREIFCDVGDGGFAEEWSQDARAVVEKHLPDHAAGFCGALAVCGAR